MYALQVHTKKAEIRTLNELKVVLICVINNTLK